MNKKLRNILGIIGAIAVIIASVVGYFSKEETPELAEGIMNVSFIDVGQGDSILIRLPDGKVMLVDAGEADESEKVIEYMNKCGVKKVDFLVGTHPHSDHIGGLQNVIENFEIKSIYMPRVNYGSKLYENLLKCIKNSGLTVKSPKGGEIIYEADGVRVEVLSPMKNSYSDLNNYSIILKISYGKRNFILTGDAENEVLNSIKIDEKADVIKVPHHGSETSDSVAFWDKVSPEYAVISVGTDNAYGHPHKEVIDILKKHKIKYLRTDEEGTIVFETDGKNLIKAESGD